MLPRLAKVFVATLPLTLTGMLAGAEPACLYRHSLFRNARLGLLRDGQQ